MKNVIGRNIRWLREARAWTQEQLAGAAGGLDVRTIQRAEKGQPMLAETLQAIAGAFDMPLEVLRTDLDDVARVAQEFEKNFKIIQLTRIDRASNLRHCMGTGATWFDHVTLDDAQEDAVAEFQQLLKDYGDLWSDLEPTQRRGAFCDIQQKLDELRDLGLVVAAGTERLRLRSEFAPDKPFVMEFLHVMISTEAEPKLAVVHERNRKISFA